MEIIDDNGIIYSGNEYEMRIAFAVMTNNSEYFSTNKEYKEAKKVYSTTKWDGDLKLISIVAIAR